MKNLKDTLTKIVPSRMRGGKELPSSSAFYSPSVLNQLVTPPPVDRPDMSHELDDATSEINDDTIATHVETENVPLNELLDAHLAKARLLENAETDEDFESPVTPRSPIRYELPHVPEGYVMDKETSSDFFAGENRDDLKKLLCKLKEKSMMEKMKYDPKFATSPIFVTDKDYELSVDPELIPIVESDPFHGDENEIVVEHLMKLNDIVALFTNDEKIRYYYILKLFSFLAKRRG